MRKIKCETCEVTPIAWEMSEHHRNATAFLCIHCYAQYSMPDLIAQQPVKENLHPAGLA